MMAKHSHYPGSSDTHEGAGVVLLNRGLTWRLLPDLLAGSIRPHIVLILGLLLYLSSVLLIVRP